MMELKPETLKAARSLLRKRDFGTLSTISLHLNGCPFGSVANYCLDRDGLPLLYFSTIAQHTKNTEADSRCSLTVLQGAGGNVQAEARITLSGRLLNLSNEKEALTRYHSYFPESIEYSKFHEFGLYKLDVTMVRFIGGFGKIHWIEPSSFFSNSPFTAKEEKFIVAHMNEDHAASLHAYVHTYAPQQDQPETLDMIGIDAEQIDLLYNGRKVTIPTSRTISDTESAREVLVEMAKACAST